MKNYLINNYIKGIINEDNYINDNLTRKIIFRIRRYHTPSKIPKMC